jgi:predicted TIM-barrel fold metal-dependent hydrolase
MAERRLWIDTHVHASAHGASGPRPNLVADLLAVLDQDAADLRWFLSPDNVEMHNVGQSPEGVLAASEFIHDLVQAAPGRFYGSCMVNPNFLDASLASMDKCFGEWGFVQLGEFLQYAFNFEMDCAATETLVRRAVEFDVPVQVHVSTSNRGGHSSSYGIDQLDDMCRLADRIPEARYIVAHAVGMEDDNPPVVDAYLDYLDDRYGRVPDNFWLEIRDFNSPGVRSVLQRVSHSRIIAGTDWTNRIGPPFMPYGTIFGVQSAEDNAYPPCVQSMVDYLRAAGAGDESIELIGSRNVIDLYKLAI